MALSDLLSRVPGDRALCIDLDQTLGLLTSSPIWPLSSSPFPAASSLLSLLMAVTQGGREGHASPARSLEKVIWKFLAPLNPESWGSGRWAEQMPWATCNPKVQTLRGSPSSVDPQ